MTSCPPATNDAAFAAGQQRDCGARYLATAEFDVGDKCVAPASGAQPAASPRMGWPVSVNVMLGRADVG